MTRAQCGQMCFGFGFCFGDVPLDDSRDRPLDLPSYCHDLDSKRLTTINFTRGKAATFIVVGAAEMGDCFCCTELVPQAGDDDSFDFIEVVAAPV